MIHGTIIMDLTGSLDTVSTAPAHLQALAGAGIPAWSPLAFQEHEQAHLGRHMLELTRDVSTDDGSLIRCPALPRPNLHVHLQLFFNLTHNRNHNHNLYLVILLCSLLQAGLGPLITAYSYYLDL
jgi:hypothetical protein